MVRVSSPPVESVPEEVAVRRPLLLFALVWASFVVIFPFAAAGDTSALHIASHVVQIPLVAAAVVVSRRLRRAAPTRAQRYVTTVLAVASPVALLCLVAELVVAIVRLARDGWRNLDTADVWEEGPHYAIASVTVPAMLLCMLATIVLVAVVALQGRRRVGAPA